MAGSRSKTTPLSNRRRGSTAQHSHYISADDDASQTESGDADTDAEESLHSRVEVIDVNNYESQGLVDLTGDDFERRDTSPDLTVDLTNHDSKNSARTRFDVVVQPGDCVECRHKENDAFLRIVQITKSHGQVYLHGDLLQRCGDVDEKFPKAGGPSPLHALMPRTKNEVCALITGTSTTSLGQARVTRRIEDVGIVRNVIFTNKPHGDLSGQSFGEFYTTEEWKEKQERGTLFCRRKYIEEMNEKGKQVVAYQILWIDQHECDSNCGSSAEQIFEDYRPNKDTNGDVQEEAKGSTKRKREVIDLIDISSDDDQGHSHGDQNTQNEKKPHIARTKTIGGLSTETTEFGEENGGKEKLTHKAVEERSKLKRTKNTITYADLCAGAGGTATGAKLAGMKIKYLLDINSDACKTLKLNFPGVTVLKMDIGAFSIRYTIGYRVDVMHISFPCQGHSLANRGNNDELDNERIATAYGTLENILANCKPRILTLEQVPGILYKKDGQHFRAQVCALTQAGYNLRWKVINFAQHGNSQARKRVIVIAACPGQILPPFPTPTHGVGANLKPFVTVADVLDQVPKLPPNHPLAYALPRDPNKTLPWDANLPLRCCITGDGGINNWHPSGKRLFSYQEKSQLQGFQPTHKYHFDTKKSLGKQIGNAVPPVFAKAMFETIIPCLEETDENMRKWRLAIEAKKAHAARNPIVLD